MEPKNDEVTAELDDSHKSGDSVKVEPHQNKDDIKVDDDTDTTHVKIKSDSMTSKMEDTDSTEKVS